MFERLRRRHLSLQATAAFVVVLACISLIGTDVWRTYATRSEALRDAWTDASNLTRSIARHAEDSFRAVDGALVGLVERLEVDGTSDVALQRLHRVLETQVAVLPQLDVIAIVDEHGDPIAISLASRSFANYADREYFQFHRSHRDRAPRIGMPLQSKLAHAWVIPVSQRFDHPDGSFAGVVVATIDIAYFQKFYETFNIGPESAIFFSLTDGTLLVRRPFVESNIGKSFAGSGIFREYLPYAPAGEGEITSPVDGVTRLSSYRTLTAYPLVVAAGISKAEALSPWRRKAIGDVFVTSALAGIIGFLGIWLSHQVRKQIRAQSTRRERDEHFRVALDAGRLATWDQDLIAGTATRSPRAGEIYGISEEEINTPGKWLDMVHPDDRDRIADMVTAAKEGRGAYAAEFRFRRSDGQERWIMTSGSIFHDAHGTPVRAVGVIQDVTERHEVESAVREREALNRSIIDAAPIGMLIMSNAGAITQANLQAEKMFGYPQGGLVGQPIAAVVPEHGIDESFIRDSEARGLVAERHLAGLRRDGSTVPIEIGISPIETRKGRIIVASVIDITRRTAAQRAVQQAKEEAESANRAKSEFLASMSHEIRTPMNGIIGFAELLLDGELSDAQRRQVTLLKDSGASLLAIINDILDLSKIEAGKLELERIAMSPVSVADGAMSIIRGQAAAKGLELRAELADDLPAWIEGDPTRLRQILLNLLSNAVKFTSSGTITLHLSRQGRAADSLMRFAVSDTGLGIPADRQHLLFQNFSQIDGSITRRFGGTGLGLAISKRLTEAMGGSIGVESEPGEGSTFHFTIALHETAGPDVAATDASGATANTSARILVAEDIYMNQVIVESMLTVAGHEVTIVSNGAAAVAAVQSGEYDLILMDMEMPEMDGIAATRAIRGLGARIGDIPIVALTANAMPEEIARCRAAGMNDHLSKPIDRRAMLAAVARWSRQPAAQPTVTEPVAFLPVLEDAVLQDLESRLGKTQVALFSMMFREEIDKIAGGMTATADRETLSRDAHTLVSLAGNLGCTELMTCSREVMETVRHELADVEALVAALKRAALRAGAAMDERYPPKIQSGVFAAG
jgi:PAS domain S-box-containing protein